MSRSTRIPVLKDKPHFNYWRQIRSRQNQIVRGYKDRYIDSTGEMDWYEDVETWRQDTIPEEIFVSSNRELLGTDIPNPKTIINDYNYCDSKWDFRNPWHDEEDKIKYSRK